MDVVEDDRAERRPIVASDGRPLTVHEDTEALALNSAVTFLTSLFGLLSEPAHACTTPAAASPPGRPWSTGDD
ncbi:MAG: hypothetical protein R2752_06505 [Vicinamibacterales bacterium]